MEADHEPTSRQFHGMVVEKYPDLSVSIGTIKRARQLHGMVVEKYPDLSVSIGTIKRARQAFLEDPVLCTNW